MSRCRVVVSSFIAVLFFMSVGGEAASVGQSGGPRVKSLAFEVATATISLVLNKPLHPGSVISDVVSVTFIDLSDANASWLTAVINTVTYNSASNTINVALGLAPPAGSLVRVILVGTGPAPVIGTNGLPLGAKVSQHAGSDYVNAFVAP